MVWMLRPTDQPVLPGADFQQDACQEMVYFSHSREGVQLGQESSRAARSIEETLLEEQF